MELVNREEYEQILKDNKVVFVCFYASRIIGFAGYD